MPIIKRVTDAKNPQLYECVCGDRSWAENGDNDKAHMIWRARHNAGLHNHQHVKLGTALESGVRR